MIFCRFCGDETNHPAPDMPTEWDGLCPACAVRAALEGQLPGRDQAMEYLIAAAGRALASGKVQIQDVDLSSRLGEFIETPGGPIHYSPN